MIATPRKVGLTEADNVTVMLVQRLDVFVLASRERHESITELRDLIREVSRVVRERVDRREAVEDRKED